MATVSVSQNQNPLKHGTYYRVVNKLARSPMCGIGLIEGNEFGDIVLVSYRGEYSFYFANLRTGRIYEPDMTRPQNEYFALEELPPGTVITVKT